MTKGDINVCEGTSSTWHYHLRHGNGTRSLCDAPVMCCNVPLSMWGQTPPNYHIPERWCSECARLHHGIAERAKTDG